MLTVALNGTIKPVNMTNRLVKRIHLEYGLEVHERKDKSVVYRKYISNDEYVEVFNHDDIISIDLCKATHILTIASQYKCTHKEQFDFLLTCGRVKSYFTTI